jgi:hypothetical protein
MMIPPPCTGGVLFFHHYSPGNSRWRAGEHCEIKDYSGKLTYPNGEKMEAS